jgi:hypothetical protein
MRLLEEIKVENAVASTLSIQKPVGTVLRAVQQARFQRNPAAWARTALEKDWKLPESVTAELGEIVETLRKDAEQANLSILNKSTADLRERYPKKAGESEEKWFERVSKELVSKKKGAKKK